MHLYLQIALILLACRGIGWIAKYFGQPRVVGEMVAGMILGPSVFGLLLPEWHQAAFPPEATPALFALSQIGLALYMFVVGLEFDTERFRSEWRRALSVSLAGMAAPFALGSMLAYALMDRQDLFGVGVGQVEASMFLGAAMCITAFPMMARIIHERGLSGSSLGTLALAAGAINDVAAWGVLALVIAAAAGEARIAIDAIGGGVIYAGVVLTLGRRLLGRLARPGKDGAVSGSALATILALVMAGAWITDILGVYAVFGTFVLGVAMPRGPVAATIGRTLDPFVSIFLLPLFFTFSGLQTTLSLVASPDLIVITLVVFAAACLGKGVACWGAARLSGQPNPEALGLGALMNARGLMELVLLNIGLERGLITPTLFAVMVVMAIATTLMATPAFIWAYGERRPIRGRTSRA